MPDKCFWCSRETADLRDIAVPFKGKTNRAAVCNAHCEQELRKFAAYADAHTRHFYFGIALSVIMGLVVVIAGIKDDYGALGVFILFAGSGLTLIKYPFVTPQTVSSLGARKAIASGRFVGWLNLAIGIVFCLFLVICKALEG